MMPIIPTHYPVASARDELIGLIGEMINSAMASPEKISPWALAEKLVEAFEEDVERVGDDGAVIYRG